MLLQKRLIEGDTAALEEVYNLYSSRVYALALKYLGNETTALDAVQDSYFKLWRNKTKISKDLPIEQQLFVITKNIIFDQFRKKVSEEKLLLSYQELLPEEENSNTELQKQRLREVYSLIETLPHRQREVFEMVRFQGLTYEEIAQKLNISKNTVSNHFSAAMRFLKTNLQLFIL